jgi:sarcosine oxidase subunit beta
MSQPSVAIIGAGIVGASCAYYLAKRGARVTVLERASQPATGSTAKSAAGIRHQFSHPENVRMSLYSAGVFATFEALTGYDAAYRKVGYLFLLPEDMLSSWGRQQAMQQALGVRVDGLSPEATAERFPYLNLAGIAGSSLGADDGVVDPHAVTLGFLRAAKRFGTTVLLGHEVLELERRAAQWHLLTQEQTVQADVIINAAGAFSGELGRRAGLEIPVAPYRRNIYATAPVPDFCHPTPLIIDMTTGIYLRSEGERFIFGLSNHNEAAGDNQAVDWAWMEHTLELALPRFPFLETAGLDRRACWAGLYEITPDHLPILGPMPGAEGFYNACGFSGHGVQHAPATGLILSEEILDGQCRSFDIRDFRYERLSQTRGNHETNIV